MRHFSHCPVGVLTIPIPTERNSEIREPGNWRKRKRRDLKKRKKEREKKTKTKRRTLPRRNIETIIHIPEELGCPLPHTPSLMHRQRQRRERKHFGEGRQVWRESGREEMRGRLREGVRILRGEGRENKVPFREGAVDLLAFLLQKPIDSDNGGVASSQGSEEDHRHTVHHPPTLDHPSSRARECRNYFYSFIILSFLYHKWYLGIAFRIKKGKNKNQKK
jgi:hypothetical protein